MINIVCALHCEAKPIIDHYKLSLVQNSIFPIFISKHGGEDINLVISGIGKVATAAAMAYLFVKNQEQKNAAWLNYGIAGHKYVKLGSWVNINKITECSSGINWYPSRFTKFDCLTGSLKTVDSPLSHYDSDALCDMEASAFMSVALKFTSIELIQVLKVVSDNEDNHLEQIDKKYVQNLLQNNIVPLIDMIELLQNKKTKIDSIYSEDVLYVRCLEKWHFTQYQKKELERLIQRWNLLCKIPGNQESENQLMTQCQDAKQVIVWFKTELDNVAVVF